MKINIDKIKKFKNGSGSQGHPSLFFYPHPNSYAVRGEAKPLRRPCRIIQRNQSI